MKTIFKYSIFILTTLFLTSAFVSEFQNPWNIPDKYKKMKNPTDSSDKEGLLDGKAIFAKQCASCHGKKGMGDGSKAATLKGDLGDFSDPEFFKTQTDGELFYKITKGKDDMPTFKKKIANEEDVWLTINYIKTLAK